MCDTWTHNDNVVMVILYDLFNMFDFWLCDENEKKHEPLIRQGHPL